MASHRVPKETNDGLIGKIPILSKVYYFKTLIYSSLFLSIRRRHSVTSRRVRHSQEAASSEGHLPALLLGNVRVFLLTCHPLCQVYATGPLRPNFRPVTNLVSTVTAVPPNRHVSKESANS